MSYRNWCITFYKKPSVNNLSENIRYLILGEEICPTTKKTHWQSYVELKKKARLSGVKKMFDDNTLHAENRQGTKDQARDYCKKDGKFEEFGEWSEQGKRNDLIAIVDDLKEGKTTLDDVAIEKPVTYCKYRNGLKDINSIILKKNTQKFRKIEVYVISGKTGYGKTSIAMNDAEYLINGSGLDWFDGYNGEKSICIDEYNNNCKIDMLLKICDGYQLRLPIKGGFTYANWTKVYITTNLSKDEFHENARDEHRLAFNRRLTDWFDIMGCSEKHLSEI